MAPKADPDPPVSISDDQLSLLIRVGERAQSIFKVGDWQKIALEEGESAEVSRQRFHYMMHKIKAMDNYNNGRETARYKPAPSNTKRGAKRAPSAPLEEDGEQMGEEGSQKSAAKLVLSHGLKTGAGQGRE